MKVFVTRRIPDKGIKLLQEKGFEAVINPEDRVLKKEELMKELKSGLYDGVLSLLTDKIDAEVLESAGKQCKIFANYAVGYDNIDVKNAQGKGIMVTNTPGVLTNSVAEHAFSLLLAIAHRISESDNFTKAGKYHGWAPMLLLGNDVAGKTLGILGLGRIGSRVAHHAKKGFDMKVIYYDLKRAEEFEKEFGAEYKENPDDIFKESDFISVHVPLLPSTRHLIDKRRLNLMKKSAFLINTSRGPVVDEQALVEALSTGVLKGAALDVFENEPDLAPGLAKLENVILTPHTASATEETRQAMSELAAKNIIEVLEGRIPPNLVKI